MKFREWEDFANQINEYGRVGYVKKQSTYNPFTKVNLMIMQHRSRFDEVIFILYPDDESFDRDYDEAAFVRPPFRSDNRVSPDELKLFQPRPDRRTRDNRSDKYPSKPGEQKERPANLMDNPNPDGLGNNLPQTERMPKPKPTPRPPQRKDKQ